MPISPSSIIKLVPPEEKKRQADAGVGDGVGNNGNVQHRLQHHLHHKANGQQRTEFIPRAHCNGHAAQKQQQEQHHRQSRAHKAKFFTQNRKR